MRAPNKTNSRKAVPIGFITGFLLLWVNPKGRMMALAAASTYAKLASGPIALGGLVGTVFGLAAALSMILWCLGGLWLSRLLKAQWHWRALNGFLALLLLASIIPMWR